jgi:hypothetical protein
MQATNIRYYKFIYSIKTFLTILLCLIGFTSFGQYSVYEHDIRYSTKYFHFGITMGVNDANYKITPDPSFITQNKILNISSGAGFGFDLGILADLHLSNKFEFRFIPTLSLGQKNLYYSLLNQDTMATRTIQSVYLEFPFHLKYKAKPYKDVRPYVIGGFKYSIDMASNAGARQAQELIKVNKNDFAIEYGTGLEIHLPMVIISPEIKVSYGLLNVLYQDPNLNYSSVIQALHARTILFCVHFEG